MERQQCRSPTERRFGAALEQGLSPVSTITGLKQVAIAAPQGVWIPRDERATEQDQLTLRAALLESNNAAAVLLQQQIGSAPVLRLASDLGVRDQPDVPSLALGSGLVTPLDLTAAYAVFPTLGYRVRPRGIVSVLNASGERVHQVHVERERIETVAAGGLEPDRPDGPMQVEREVAEPRQVPRDHLDPPPVRSVEDRLHAVAVHERPVAVVVRALQVDRPDAVR